MRINSDPHITFLEALVMVLVFMVLAPISVQLIYMIPLFEPKVSADSVLAFWGTVAGLFAGGKVLGDAKREPDWTRKAEYFPRFEASVDYVNGVPYMKFINTGKHPFFVLTVCNVPVDWIVRPDSEKSFSIPDSARPERREDTDVRSCRLSYGETIEYVLTVKADESVYGFSLLRDGRTGKWSVFAL